MNTDSAYLRKLNSKPFRFYSESKPPCKFTVDSANKGFDKLPFNVKPDCGRKERGKAVRDVLS